MTDAQPDREPTREPFDEGVSDPSGQASAGAPPPAPPVPPGPDVPAYTPESAARSTLPGVPEDAPDGEKPSRVTPVLLLIAGLVVLGGAVAAGRPVSIASILGVLLLLSAAVRFEIARRS